MGESDEGDEGEHEGESRDDGKCSIQLCGRDDRLEIEGREGCDGGYDVVGSRAAKEERQLQAGRCVEHEAQEEASTACTQGRQPVHKGAMRLQGQASVEDCASATNEEVEGDDQLSRSVSDVALCWAQLSA